MASVLQRIFVSLTFTLFAQHVRMLQFSFTLSNHGCVTTFLHIYIFMCVCACACARVCVCVCVCVRDICFKI
uniref:Uncharacterized protein n=1 Tax=Rhipicephalus microplus TaxID=6941 RepID=A0A6G5AH23_RHIMP